MCAYLCTESERRYSGTVLSEVDDQMFAWANSHRGAVFILSIYDNLAVGII